MASHKVMTMQKVSNPDDRQGFIIELERITEKGVGELTEHEAAFLRARRSYLSDEQLEQYKEVLEPKPIKKVTRSKGKPQKE